MLTNQEQKDKLLAHIKQYYGFVTIHIRKDDMLNGVLTIEALKNGTLHFLKYEGDNTLYTQSNGKWIKVNGFTFEE